MKKIILYGTGNVALNVFRIIGGDNVECFCETVITKDVFCEKKVISLQQLTGICDDYYVLVAVLDEKARREISNELTKNKISYYLLDEFEINLLKISMYVGDLETFFHKDRIAKRNYHTESEIHVCIIPANCIAICCDSYRFFFSNENRMGNSITKVVLFNTLVNGIRKPYVNSQLIKMMANHFDDVLTDRNFELWINKFRCNKEQVVFYDAYWQSRVRQNVSHNFVVGKNEKKDGQLEINQNTKKKLRDEIQKLGIDKPYICFANKDLAYNKAIWKPSEWIHKLEGEFRCSNVESFSIMADKLKGKGIKCVRMGAIVDKPFNHDNVLDYAYSARTELRDIALFSECEFFIGDGSGILEMAKLFGKPIAVINTACLYNYRDANHSVDYIIYRKLYDTKNNRYLTLKDIASIQNKLWNENPNTNGVYDLYKYYLENGIISECNTREEIADLADEINDDNNGISKIDQDIEMLRNKYMEIVREFYNDGFNVMAGKIGGKWIKDNSWFLS